MKLIALTFYDTQWTADWKQLLIRSDAKRLLVNIELIASVSPKPIEARDTVYGIKNLHYVKTMIPNGRGINGVDYSGYYVTEETYATLTDNIEIVG